MPRAPTVVPQPLPWGHGNRAYRGFRVRGYGTASARSSRPTTAFVFAAGWNMSALIPELARDAVRGVFDGELVAFREGIPHFPLVIARMLHRRSDVPVAFAVTSFRSTASRR